MAWAPWKARTWERRVSQDEEYLQKVVATWHNDEPCSMTKIEKEDKYMQHVKENLTVDEQVTIFYDAYLMKRGDLQKARKEIELVRLGRNRKDMI